MQLPRENTSTRVGVAPLVVVRVLLIGVEPAYDTDIYIREGVSLTT